MKAKLTFEVEIDNDDMIFLKHCEMDENWEDIREFLSVKLDYNAIENVELNFEE